MKIVMKTGLFLLVLPVLGSPIILALLPFAIKQIGLDQTFSWLAHPLRHARHNSLDAPDALRFWTGAIVASLVSIPVILVALIVELLT